jgi:hypothetical protein
MSDTPKQSDQLPEEAPVEQVPDDVPGAGEGAARESGRRQAADANKLGYRDSDEQEAYEHAGDQGQHGQGPAGERDDRPGTDT